MKRALPSARESLRNERFRQAMEELCKNKGITFKQAETDMGFEYGFTDRVYRKLHELTLEEVLKIANYFHTTMESVLDGGHYECRVHMRGCDDLGMSLEKDCLKAYSSLLSSKAQNYRLDGLCVEDVNEDKRKLEKCELAYMKHYKDHLDKVEAEIKAKEMIKCEDDILVKELQRRGYKVDKVDKAGE